MKPCTVPAALSGRVAGRLEYSPQRFRQYATELSLAVFALSEETKITNRYGVRYYTQGKDMSITGLQSGAFKLLLAEMKQEIAAAQTQGIADVKAAKNSAATEIKNTIASVKSRIKSEVSDALQEFSEFTNGPEIEEPEAEKPTPLPTVDLIHDDTGNVERHALSIDPKPQPDPS